MRKIIFVGLMFLSFPIWAQKSIKLDKNLKTRLEKTLDAYFLAMHRREFNKAMDYVYPEIFVKILPRDKFINQLEERTHQEAMDVKILMPVNIEIFPDGLEDQNKKYFLVRYQNQMELHLKQKPQEADPNYKSRINYTFYKLKKTYGKQNVSRPAEDPSVIRLSVPKYILAIYDPASTRFYFTDYTDAPKNQMMLAKFLPAGILEYFNMMLSNDRKNH